MARKGGKSHKIYVETCGIKVSGGQVVKSGTVLTRQGDRWKPGINVLGLMHLTAACAGEVYFTKKRNSKNGKIDTIVNVRQAVKKA
ncbi:MAG: 50S ribosomal protein L27 [Candidatus Omnitrophica bacterium]|nr:50S ribosomal protein L27 [Candidatus Omnitrophota bacterium]